MTWFLILPAFVSFLGLICRATEKLLSDLLGNLCHALSRVKTPGGTYFFTVATFRRRKFLCEPDNVALLRTVLQTVKSFHPFTIDAFVLLPEHLHCIWTLPPGDHDYPMRWNVIKNYFTLRCPDTLKSTPSAFQRHKRAQTIWQPRYWEHQIRDDRDFEKHCDYIHWPPVKHGLTANPAD
jgi:putative transposase